MSLDQDFIFREAPFPSCHSSTIVELLTGDLLGAWFGGTKEGAPDVAVWASRQTDGRWSDPIKIASEPDIPCGNPALFFGPDRTIWLFYKVGRKSQEWSGAYTRSWDDGRTWSEPIILPAGLLGPIKNKPILLSTGKILCGTSVESYKAWTCWVERLNPDGTDWHRFGSIIYPNTNYGLIQPTLIETSPGNIRAFMRATRNIGSICVADSKDEGVTWSYARKTQLPNPNSGIDAVRVDSGAVVMVYNHTPLARSPLNIAISHDDGDTWSEPKTLEDGPREYSYPAVIQTSDGLIHTTYTWRRERIRHCVLTEDWLMD